MPRGVYPRAVKPTPEVQQRICDALSAGNTREAACCFARVSQDSLAIWLKKNPEFRAAVDKAEGDAEVRHVANVVKAGAKEWKASRWWLERRRPQEWGAVEKIELSGPAGGPLTFREVVVEIPREKDDADTEGG